MFQKNTIQLTGNITKAPKTRTAGESTVTRARLIHNETIRKADGETVERVVAVDLDIWGKRGEAFAEHVTSKVPVYIEGRLQLDQWEKDGKPQSRLLVRVEDWQFLAPKADGEADSGKTTKQRRGSKAA